MADKQERDKIEYEFDDLRRNTDPVPNLVLAQLGIDSDGDDERQDGKKRREAAQRKDDEDDRSRDRDDDDRDDDRDDLDDDEKVTLSRKDLSRQLNEARRQAERKARREIQAARAEAGAEIGKLSKRLDGIERAGKSEEIEAEFAPQIADVQQQIEAAMEGGDSKKVIELNGKLAELMADRKIKVHQAKTAAEDTEDDDEQGTKPRTLPRAQEWLDEQDWFDDPDYAHVRAYLNNVDKRLQEKGYRPTDDDYYVELERKLEKKFPRVITKTMDEVDEDDEDDEDDRDRGRSRRRDDEDDDDDIPDKSRRNRRRQREAGRRSSPVSEGDRGGVNRDRQRRRERDSDTVTLTRAQIANMRAFGLDPDNSKHVEEYQLEVRRSRRSER